MKKKRKRKRKKKKRAIIRLPTNDIANQNYALHRIHRCPLHSISSDSKAFPPNRLTFLGRYKSR